MTDAFNADAWGYWYPQAASPVLKDVDARMERGQIALVVGPSGSGKTTFLRALNGLVPHFTGGRIQGRLAVMGHDPVASGPSHIARYVGMVFQDPECQGVQELVEDEIALALENQAVHKPVMRERVNAVMEQLGVAHLRQRVLATLSGGERQRVALASVLVAAPQLLVLDEPTSQLDPESAEMVLTALDSLHRHTELTVIAAEHRLERLLAYTQVIVDVARATVRVDARDTHAWDAHLSPPNIRLARKLQLSAPFSSDADYAAAARCAVAPEDRSRAALRARDTGGQPLLVVEHLDGGYRGGFSVEIDRLHVHEGELVVVMGRNGSGKSTLLKLILGLVMPRRGRVLAHGKVVSGRPTHEISAQIAYLPQDPNALLFSDTVVDEFNLTLSNHRLPRLSSSDAAVFLNKLRIGGLENAYPRDLSVGQRERAAIGTVTVTSPSIILLDEPTRGLDYESKAALAALLREWKAAGCAIVVVTHDVEFTAEIADRVIVMAAGRLTADGDPRHVLTTTPGLTPFVARVFPDTDWLTVDDVPTPGARPKP